jgi:hypothetical protein
MTGDLSGEIERRGKLWAMRPMWEWELRRWRDKLYRERGGPVRLRIRAIEELDRAILYLMRMHSLGRVQPDADWGAWKN